MTREHTHRRTALRLRIHEAQQRVDAAMSVLTDAEQLAREAQEALTKAEAALEAFDARHSCNP